MAVQERKFSGVLTEGDTSRHVNHTFHVADGVAELSIALAMEVSGEKPKFPAQISMSVFGPQGYRGTRHNNANQSVYLSTERASFGYLPGAIEAGEWMVSVDVHRVSYGECVAYTLTVSEDGASSNQALHSRLMDEPAECRPEPGWFVGDLHCHSNHSDAEWDVNGLACSVNLRNLDFSALTDHNTVSGLDYFRQAADHRFSVISGVEISSFFGHLLALGVREQIDWRMQSAIAVQQVIENARAMGGVLIVAHPCAPGLPCCAGCKWEVSNFDFSLIDGIEVWNGDWNDGEVGNEAALQLYYSLLRSGLKLIATSGTDAHGSLPSHWLVGHNRIRSESRDPDKLLAALRSGRCVISSGPSLEVLLRSRSGAINSIGDRVPAGDYQLEIEWSGADKSGGLAIVSMGGGRDLNIQYERGKIIENLRGDVGDWVCVELRDGRNSLNGLTNPIYFT